MISAESEHERARGAPIVRAFQRGLDTFEQRPEVVVKLDGDLFLPPHYFEWVAATFARDPRAGIVGGVALIPEDGRWVPERGNLLNVNGVAKAYRVACLDEIGGLRPSMGWDGIDEYGARARGWNVRVLTRAHAAPLPPARLEAEGAQGALGGGARQCVHGLSAQLAARARGLPRVRREAADHRRPRAARRATRGRAFGGCRRSTTRRRAPSCARSSGRGSRASSAAGGAPALAEPDGNGPAYWATGPDGS